MPTPEKDQTPAEAREAAQLAPSKPKSTDDARHAAQLNPPFTPANPAPQSAGLTEDAIRGIIRDELAKYGPSLKAATPAGWYHDAGHSADQARLDAQQLRDRGAGINVPEKASA